MSGTQDSKDKAERELIEWAEHNQLRDGIVRTAKTVGLSINRIHKLSGIARSTIYKILGQS